MNCSEFQDKLAESLEGLLEPAVQQTLDAHRRSCPACQKEFETASQLHRQLQDSAGEYHARNLDDEVMNRIFCEQQKQIRRLTMLRTYKKLSWAASIAAVFAIVLFFSWPTQKATTASAAEILAQAVDAMSDLKSVYIQARIRTIAHDNFDMIGLDYDFVTNEMWKVFEKDGPGQWRVEKSGRVVVMDGTSSTLWIRPPANLAAKGGVNTGFVQWLKPLMDVDKVVYQVFRMVSQKECAFDVYNEIGPDGREKTIITLELKAEGDYTNDYLKNKSITDSDHQRIYTFDAQTKLLEGLQVYVHAKDNDVLVFEITLIEYNPQIDPALFTLDLPEDVAWFEEPQSKSVGEQYLEMGPKEMAEAFFRACGAENWEEVKKFWPMSEIPQRIKDAIGGLELISLGEPFQSGRYPGWFVPYEIRFRNGSVKKMNLAVRNDNAAKRYVFDGGL